MSVFSLWVILLTLAGSCKVGQKKGLITEPEEEVADDPAQKSHDKPGFPGEQVYPQQLLLKSVSDQRLVSQVRFCTDEHCPVYPLQSGELLPLRLKTGSFYQVRMCSKPEAGSECTAWQTGVMHPLEDPPALELAAEDQVATSVAVSGGPRFGMSAMELGPTNHFFIQYLFLDGLEQEETQKGLFLTTTPKGLPNLGNTCFMNASLQVVAHSETMTDSIRKVSKLMDPLSISGGFDQAPRADQLEFLRIRSSQALWDVLSMMKPELQGATKSTSSMQQVIARYLEAMDEYLLIQEKYIRADTIRSRKKDLITYHKNIKKRQKLSGNKKATVLDKTTQESVNKLTRDIDFARKEVLKEFPDIDFSPERQEGMLQRIDDAADFIEQKTFTQLKKEGFNARVYELYGQWKSSWFGGRPYWQIVPRQRDASEQIEKLMRQFSPSVRYLDIQVKKNHNRSILEIDQDWKAPKTPDKFDKNWSIELETDDHISRMQDIVDAKLFNTWTDDVPERTLATTSRIFAPPETGVPEISFSVARFKAAGFAASQPVKNDKLIDLGINQRIELPFSSLGTDPGNTKILARNMHPDRMWKQKMELRSAIVHQGLGANSGHYITYVKEADGTWWRMSDTYVRQVDAASAIEEIQKFGISLTYKKLPAKPTKIGNSKKIKNVVLSNYFVPKSGGWWNFWSKKPTTPAPSFSDPTEITEIDPGTPLKIDPGTPLKIDPGTPVKIDPGTPVKIDSGTPVKIDPDTPVKTKTSPRKSTGNLQKPVVDSPKPDPTAGIKKDPGTPVNVQTQPGKTTPGLQHAAADSKISAKKVVGYAGFAALIGYGTYWVFQNKDYILEEVNKLRTDSETEENTDKISDENPDENDITDLK